MAAIFTLMSAAFGGTLWYFRYSLDRKPRTAYVAWMLFTLCFAGWATASTFVTMRNVDFESRGFSGALRTLFVFLAMFLIIHNTGFLVYIFAILNFGRQYETFLKYQARETMTGIGLTDYTSVPMRSSGGRDGGDGGGSGAAAAAASATSGGRRGGGGPAPSAPPNPNDLFNGDIPPPPPRPSAPAADSDSMAVAVSQATGTARVQDRTDVADADSDDDSALSNPSDGEGDTTMDTSALNTTVDSSVVTSTVGGTPMRGVGSPATGTPASHGHGPRGRAALDALGDGAVLSALPRHMTPTGGGRAVAPNAVNLSPDSRQSLSIGTPETVSPEVLRAIGADDGGRGMTPEAFEELWNGLYHVGAFSCTISRVPTLDEVMTHLAARGFVPMASGTVGDEMKLFFYAEDPSSSNSAAVFLSQFVFNTAEASLEATFKGTEEDQLGMVQKFELHLLFSVVGAVHSTPLTPASARTAATDASVEVPGGEAAAVAAAAAAAAEGGDGSYAEGYSDALVYGEGADDAAYGDAGTYDASGGYDDEAVAAGGEYYGAEEYAGRGDGGGGGDGPGTASSEDAAAAVDAVPAYDHGAYVAVEDTAGGGGGGAEG